MNSYRVSRDIPNSTVLNNDPYICIVDDFISPELCDHIISLATPDIEPASVVQEGGGTALSNTRTNRVTFILHGRDPLVDKLVTEIAQLVQLPRLNSESLQVINYQEGQRYDPHFDTFEPNSGFTELSGQRVITALIYLVDVESGGETKFPQLDLDVKPKRGRIVIFQTCEDGTSNPNEKSLHGGMPVIAGEKWAANLWFREKKFIG